MPIDKELVFEMFDDALKGRPAVNEKQANAGITIEELQYAVKGRHAWDTTAKQWTIKYKPYRKYWVLLLLTVNERLFALQVPKVVPGKIVTQYEEQDQLR